jgi:hypothetical protein
MRGSLNSVKEDKDDDDSRDVICKEGRVCCDGWKHTIETERVASKQKPLC